MTIWMPSRTSLTRPLHTSLAASMKEAIADGRLAVGTRLPPHRELAGTLGLSVHTVSKAYDELRRQGLVNGRVGRGTFVTQATQPQKQPFLMERDPTGTIDLSISRPAYDAIHVEEMERALASLGRGLDHDTYLACRPNIGLAAHRRTGLKWLRRCGLVTSEETVAMTNGVCHGMTTALASITRPGDVVATEAVAHHLIISLCAYLGLRTVGLQSDQEGILPDAFEAACRDQQVKTLFTVPTLASPTVSVMSEERRRAITDIARRHDVLIVEDDAWGPVMEDRPPPLAALAPERVVYLTSFTKCTLPGLRTGYLVAPDTLLPAITGRIIVFNWMATPLISELASRWVEDGTAARLVAWQRATIAERYRIVVEEMAGLNWIGHPAALHFWLRMPGAWSAGDLVQHARALGVAVAPPDPFLTAECLDRNAVRIAVGAPHDPGRFRKGLQIIRELLKRPPEPYLHAL